MSTETAPSGDNQGWTLYDLTLDVRVLRRFPGRRLDDILKSPHADQHSRPVPEPYRTLQGWAVGVLLEAHAIRECDDHGHMRDRTDPDAWQHAREIAARHPFRGATPEQAIEALDEVMQSVGDTCPGCN